LCSTLNAHAQRSTLTLALPAHALSRSRFIMSTRSKETIPLLNATNYEEWAPRMEHYLSKHDLWWTIGYTKSAPLRLDPMAKILKLNKLPNYKLKWEMDNNSALRAIMTHCDPTRFEELKGL